MAREYITLEFLEIAWNEVADAIVVSEYNTERETHFRIPFTGILILK